MSCVKNKLKCIIRIFAIPSDEQEGIAVIRANTSCMSEGLTEIRGIPSFIKEWTSCKQDIPS